MANLEKFIKDNRDQFDDQQPREGFWAKIEAKLFPAGNQRNSPVLWNSLAFWRAAAAVLLLATMFFAVNDRVVLKDKELSSLEKEFVEIEKYYLQQIAEKANLIKTRQSIWADAPDEQDLLRLEAMYMVLKEEMKNSPSQEVKDALTLNLILRTEMLNKRLEELDQAATDHEI
ncbi:MAG TPA: hypothetical protein PKC24_14840 [Cyclobacteriaceae bacterium]|nr:hypothetical protein [Cyclobacteriaceae bacterium]